MTKCWREIDSPEPGHQHGNEPKKAESAVVRCADARETLLQSIFREFYKKSFGADMLASFSSKVSPQDCGSQRMRRLFRNVR